MATAKKNTVTKKSAPGVNITNHNLVIRSANRGSKDIGDWRNAHRAAESSLLEIRTQLYDMFNDIELDPHLSSVIDKRLMAVTNVKLRFIKEGKDVEALNEVLKSKEFKKLLKEVLKSKMWGITLAETSFRPFNAWIVPRKHIRPKNGIIAYEQSSDTGFSYREGMYLNTMVEVGEPDDLGLLLKAAPFVLIKRGCMGDWAQFTEIFGMPTKVGRYSGYDNATRLALENALDEAGSALSIVIPEEAKLEFLESKTTNASPDLYKSLINLCDEQISILILGQTETTKSSESSGYAQSKTHAQTEADINKDDRAFVISILETSITHVLTQAGYPMEGGEWVFENDEESLSLKDRVEIDTKLKAAGLPIDDEYFYTKYSIPMPKDYVKIKANNEVKKKVDEKKTSKKELSLSEDLLQKMNDFFA